MSRNEPTPRRASWIWLAPLVLGLSTNLPPLTPAAPVAPPAVTAPTNAPANDNRLAAAGAAGPMSVHVINVGRASATLLEFPRGAVLVDAGNEELATTEEDQDPAQVVTYLEEFFQRRTDLDRTLQAVIITHPHIDHTSALD